jgi:hypothetical protein
MTAHLISVGLSVRDALEKPRGKLGDKKGLVDAILAERPNELLACAGIRDEHRDEASDWLAAALAAQDEPGRDPAKATRLAEIAAKIGPELWPDEFSAEIETFARVQRAGHLLSPDDVAVLICSDTPRGLLAGVWNALALTGGTLARIGYLPKPGASLGAIRGRALLVRVPGMDAGDEPGFRLAMGGLGRLARNLFKSGSLKKDEPFRFYLSGGFKAAIPYLIGMAEATRSIDRKCLRELGNENLMPERGPWRVEAWVLHETAGPDAPAIRLPLRLLDAEAVRYELKNFNADLRRTEKLSPALLNGYAYEATGRPGKEVYHLTAFGEGLRELFGVPYEGYSG